VFSSRFFRYLTLLAIGTVLLAPGILGEDANTRKIKSSVPPEYPEIAKRMHLAGTVRIQVTITPEGKVKSTKVLGGNPLLADAAVEAIKKWKFETAKEETTEVIPFEFKGTN
jgi:TonB family protein